MRPAPGRAAAPAQLLRSLGLGDATLLIIGCIVGVGIFRTSSSIAAHVPSPALILALWLIGGAVSLCGALCYAELAAMFPRSGGDYVYISEIYGRFWGFLFGWTKLFVERTGTIAILAFVFAEYLGRMVPLSAGAMRAIATAAILLLTAVNVLGIRWGTLVQNVFTILKIGALAAVIAAGVWIASGGAQPLGDGLTAGAGGVDWSLGPLEPSMLPAMGVAFVFVLWTFGGWTESAYVADEVRDPTRNIPRSIIRGLLAVTGLYILVNWSYLVAIPAPLLAERPLVAADTLQAAIGGAGTTLISAMVVCSAFGALNGYILTGARILYALGRDHEIFARLGAVHPRFRTPAVALWMNAAIAIALVLTRTFDQIMIYSTVAISVFFTMAVYGLILLRRTRPDATRPYRAWGYPFSPILYCLVMAAFILSVCAKEPEQAVFGFAWLAAGAPLYWASLRLTRSSPGPADAASGRAAS
ncbi:MAG TPA: amino acid permease [bacterium]